MIQAKFGLNWPSDFRGEDFLKSFNDAWVRAWLCKFTKAAASDKVYQLLAHGQWLSSGTPASTTKTGCHDIAEILLKVALKHQWWPSWMEDVAIGHNF
jgi:hypothetical protein